MIRNFVRRLSALSVIPLSIVILISLLASVALAQMTSAGQSSRKQHVVTGLSAVDASEGKPYSRLRPKMFGGRAPDTGDPFFLPAVSYDSGCCTYDMAVADVNRDGKVDVLVVDQIGYTFGVLMGKQDGTFDPVHTYYLGFEPGFGSPAIEVADVNADGKPDLLVAVTKFDWDYDRHSLVGLLLGNGDGTFQPIVTFNSTDQAAGDIAVADVNGDHEPDLLVANDFNVAVLLGNGDGTFGAPQFYDTDGQVNASIAVGDFNGDGRLDLVVAAASACILMGNGDGTFQPAVTYGSGGINPEFVAVADVNGDSRLDLLVANTDSNSVGVLLGNGDGTFQPAASYGSGGTNAAAVAVADVNGDGKPDLLVANNCGVDEACGGFAGVLGVLLGNGDGTFQAAVTYLSGGAGANSVIATDVNGDGKPDVLMANYYLCIDHLCGNGVVGVLLNAYGPHRATTTTVDSSLNPAVFGQTIIFTAKVSSSSGTPKGTVIFYDGSTALGSATLLNGSTSFSISTLHSGSRSITAVYQGSGVFDRSGSPQLSEVVNIAFATMSLTSSLNPAEINQPVTYTATITGQYGGAASGFVSFMEKGKRIGFVQLESNRATITTSYKANSTHYITASYPGDENNTGSSAALTQYIRLLPVASMTVLTTSESPSMIGESVTFTATVTSKYGAIPDGELVTIYDGATPLGSVALSGGVATYTTSSLSAKSHFIKAVYAGDAIFKTSAAHLRQVVNK